MHALKLTGKELSFLKDELLVLLQNLNEELDEYLDSKDWVHEIKDCKTRMNLVLGLIRRLNSI